MNPELMVEHLLKDRYGDFVLTDAIRPALDQPILPRQAYRIENYRDPKANFKVPVLAASISRERLFDAFLDMLDPLGDVVDVVLETSHNSDGQKHQDLFREAIDLPILKSYCCDFEDLLLNDGCTGIAVLSTNGPMEVQFDEHKLLVVYAANLKPFRRVLEGHAVYEETKLRLITEGEHLHATDPRFRKEFDQFCMRLGVGEGVESLNW